MQHDEVALNLTVLTVPDVARIALVEASATGSDELETFFILQTPSHHLEMQKSSPQLTDPRPCVCARVNFIQSTILNGDSFETADGGALVSDAKPAKAAAAALFLLLWPELTALPSVVVG